MKAKTLAAAVLTALAAAACGGGSDGNGNGNGSAVSTTSGSSSGTSSGTGSGSNISGGTGSLSSSDATYLGLAYQTGQGTAQQSQVVSQKTANPDVKVLAQQLTTEINVTNQQITQVSQANQVTITNNLTSQQQTQINMINMLSGAALDQTYVKDVVDAWKSLLAATLAQARQGANIQVRQTASANVLAIEQRLGAAQQLLIVLQPTAYLVDAYQDGLLEIQLGQLALQKGSDAQVKQFGQRMIDDHTQINASVAALAKQKNVTLLTDLSAEQKEIVALLSGFSGADFDKAYMDRNVLLHVEDVSKTSIESQQGSDPDIKALAAQGLPVLQTHLQLAQSLAARLKGSALYQLGQSLVTELQLAQLAQVRSTDSQVRIRAQQIMNAGQASYAQLIQLSQQLHATVPLSIPADQVQSVQQLTAGAASDFDRAVLSLINQFTSLSLQQVQSLQAGVDTNVLGFAKRLLTALQSLVTQVTTGAAGTGTTSTGTTGTNTINTTDTGATGSRIIGRGP